MPEPTMLADQMHAYADARGFSYEPEGLLPPISELLARGLGVGDHETHPERATLNLCQGDLSGGVGVCVAHHQYLEFRPGEGSEGSSWHVVSHTVATAILPERSRALCGLTLSPSQPPATDPGADHYVQRRGGHAFDVDLAEDAETLDAVESPATLAALARVPEGTAVEYADGVLCVSAPGVVAAHDRLDAMCGVVAGIADGIRATVARHGDLDPVALLPVPAPGARRQWLDAGVDRVRWPRPPASVSEARRAYEPVVAKSAAAAGQAPRRRLTAALLIACVLWFALCYGIFSALGTPGWGLVFGGATSSVLAWGVVNLSSAAGKLARSDAIASQAGPWAMEAFVRGYADARGLILEDPVAFRRRFTSPLPGRPQRVMGGDLGDGVRGHLVLWRDWVRGAHWLVAVVPAGDGTPESRPPYQAVRAAGALTVAREVDASERTAAALDEIASEARRLVRSA